MIVASRAFGSRLRRREWASIPVMTVSLAELLHCLSPSAGRSASTPWFVWVIGNGASLGLAGVLWPWRGAVPPGKEVAEEAAPARQPCWAWPAVRELPGQAGRR